MFFRPVPLAAVATTALLALGFAGCSSKPENSPVVRKKFEEINELKTEVAETNRTLRSLTDDITIIKDEMSNLRALAPDAAGGSELVRRLDDIERRLNQIGGSTPATVASATPASSTEVASAAPRTATVTQTTGPGGLAVPATSTSSNRSTSTAPAPATSASTTAAAPRTTNAVNFTGTGGRALSPAASSAAAPTTTRSTAPAATTSRTTTSSTTTSTNRGRYYVLQDGDTLENLASSNGVTIAALRQANGLPEGARPLKGQRLFIPAR